MDAQKSKNKDENEIKKSHHAQLLPPGGREGEGEEGGREKRGGEGMCHHSHYTLTLLKLIFSEGLKTLLLMARKA